MPRPRCWPASIEPFRSCATGAQRSKGLPPELDAESLSARTLESLKQGEGALQLGTLGRGNHFVELQADETDRLWLMLHSGSRAIGQAIRDLHLRRCMPGRSGLALLDAESSEGRAYLADMAWAVDYAEESRRGWWLLPAMSSRARSGSRPIRRSS